MTYAVLKVYLVQVRLHVVEHHVQILIVLGLDHLLQFDYVLVALQLLQENHFTEGTLGISGVVERIKNLKLKRIGTFFKATI
jgi:hypothetical protein